MALVDLENRAVIAKIVYYGPAQSGKTTNLRAIYGALPESERALQAEFDADGEPTVFFDYVPVDLGDASGVDITLRLYSVSGQEGKSDARTAVLTGADGVVFVADASAGREDENARSMQELRSVLAALHPSEPDIVPIVVQFNKLDLDNTSNPDQLSKALGAEPTSAIYASALQRRGPVETLALIAQEVVKRL